MPGDREVIWLILAGVVFLAVAAVIHWLYPDTSFGGLLLGFLLAMAALIPVAVVVCVALLMTEGNWAVVYVGAALGIVLAVWIWVKVARRKGSTKSSDSPITDKNGKGNGKP